MPTPNEWRSDIVLVDDFPNYLKELSEDGYTIFSAVQHSVDGYYLIVSYPAGTAGQFSLTSSGAKVYDEEVKTAINQLTASILGGELPSGSTGLATHELQHSGIDALYTIRDQIVSGNNVQDNIFTDMATADLQQTGNTALSGIHSQLGDVETTGTALWELDQIRQNLNLADVYPTGTILASQTGPNNNNTGNVLTFTFPQVMEQIHVAVIDTSNTNQQIYFRVDPFGGTPSSTAGMVGQSNNEFDLHVRCQTVKVWFVGQHNCTVWGFLN